MSDRYQGGLITKTPVTPSGPYQDGAAPGIWTLEQQAYWKAQGLWPIAGNIDTGDAYFDYVGMLLNGNGTNGAQNNTFLDSSSNAFSITRNGNATQGSFSPYGSLWSNYFNSNNSSYLSFTSSAFDFSSSDITVEAWVNPSSAPQGSAIISEQYNGGGDTIAFAIAFGSSPGSGSGSNIFVGTYDGSNWIAATGSALTIGVWTHVAGVYSSGTWKLYINGSLVSTSSSVTITSDNDAWYISKRWDASGTPSFFNGYISNLRVVKSAVYTGNFTPSTTPLTAISNTVLLTCQSNRFIDNSTNNISLTVNGTSSIQRFNPFNPTTSYSTSTIGGSGYFDSNGSLSVPDSSVFDLGSNDFTLEGWVYRTGNSYQGRLVGQYSGGSDQRAWGVFIETSGAITVITDDNGTTPTTSFSTSSNAAPLNTWTHIRVSRVGTTAYVGVNGAILTSGTVVSNIFSSSATVDIGNTVEGYITDVRVINGTALSTSSYTVPTAPLTAVTNTQLLCNMTNAGIPDYAMINDLETAGTAQVSTSVVKYGTGSIYFQGDGSGSYLKTAGNPVYYFGTGDFTIESWIYNNETGAAVATLLSSAAASSSTSWFRVKCDSAGLTTFSTAGSDRVSATISLNTWVHVAIVRYGSTITMYVNGTSVSTATYATTIGASNIAVYVGTEGATDGSFTNRVFGGYIDDLRITTGYARYTSNFTPPTSAFKTF